MDGSIGVYVLHHNDPTDNVRLLCGRNAIMFTNSRAHTQVSWIVTTTKATTVNIQYRSSTGREFWLVGLCSTGITLLDVLSF